MASIVDKNKNETRRQRPPCTGSASGRWQRCIVAILINYKFALIASFVIASFVIAWLNLSLVRHGDGEHAHPNRGLLGLGVFKRLYFAVFIAARWFDLNTAAISLNETAAAFNKTNQG